MRIAVNVFILLLAFLLQTAVFPFISPFGVKPDMLLIAVICVASFAGALEGAVIGLCTGVALDIMYMNFVGFYTIPYLLAGAASGFLYRGMRLGRVIFPVVAAAVFAFIKETFDIILVYFMHVDINWPVAFLKILLICAFTAVAALPVFQGFYALDKLKLFNRKSVNIFGDRLT